MKTLFLLALFVTLSSCAHHGAWIESARLKPTKSGVIALSDNSKDAKKMATKIMKKFCAPQMPELVQIDQVTSVTGSSTTRVARGVQITSNDTTTQPKAQFDCVDNVHQSISDTDLD